MFRTSAAALLMSTALVTGAIAQTTTTEPSTMAPAPSGMSSTTAPAAAPMAGSAQFMSRQEQGQFRASKFVGLAIYGTDNNRVGDINEILIDGTGSAKGIVIGVGGFLGIGEKNVAVPFSAVQWVNERPVTTAATGTTTSPPATGMGMGARDASTTGSTAAPAPTTAATPAAANRSPAEMAAANGYPDHGKITMTKADLQNAPAFKWYSETK